MICPYCSYEHGWNGDVMEMIDGCRGDFYTLDAMLNASPIGMSRGNAYGGYDIKTLHACPDCRKVFID